MRPSQTRRVIRLHGPSGLITIHGSALIACVVLWLAACHEGDGVFTSDDVMLTGSGANSTHSSVDEGAGNDTPPDSTTPPGSDDTTDDTTDDGAEASDACRLPAPTDEAVALNLACDIPLQGGGFDPVVEWKWGDHHFCGPAVAGQTIDSNANGRLDDDDLPLLFLYRNADVVALWGDGSGVAWEADGNYGDYDGGLALGDLDGDGWQELVTANNSAVCALDARDGSEKWCSVDLGDGIDPNGINYPAIADMDGDGQAEVILGSKILSSTGAVIGSGKLGKGGTPWDDNADVTYGVLSAVVDLDGDGVQEVVTGSAAYDLDGNTVWENGGLDGFVAVADFDLDGQGEIIKTSGTKLYGMESDGTEVWGPIDFAIDEAGYLGPPAIDDLDGDGTPELVVSSYNRLVALRWGGETMWTAEIEDFSGSAGPVLFDFEKDGFPEVLYADEVAVRFFSGLDGSLKFLSHAHASDTLFETPIVADIDGDDQVEIVVGHCSGDAEIGAITVYGDAGESWPPGRKTWNQHTYHISNVGDLGHVPAAYASNWLTDNNFNSFRSGDVGAQPGEFHDLQAEVLHVCEASCADGSVSVTARVRNAGTLEVPAGLAITLRAGETGPVVAAQLTTRKIPAATTGELVTFVVDAADLAGTRPVVTVDDQGAGDAKLYECDEQNNTATWSTPVCANP
jgi:hypothetical protein